MENLKKDLENLSNFTTKQMGFKYRKLKSGDNILRSAYFWRVKSELAELLWLTNDSMT